jgi:hypothetical protein
MHGKLARAIERAALGRLSRVCGTAVLLLSAAGCTQPGKVDKAGGSTLAGSSSTATTATDPVVFTHSVAEHLRQSLAGTTVTEQGPLTLVLQSATGKKIDANLDRLYRACQSQDAACQNMLARFTAASGEILRDTQPPTADKLRLVVRSKTDIDAMAQAVPGLSDGDERRPITQPLAGDLWQVLVFDYPTSLRYATQQDLDSLKLSQADAITKASANLAGSLAPLASVTHDLGPHQIGIIQGNAYDPSRLLIPKDWAKVAQALDGHLLVAVPSSDTVLYGEENGVQSVRALAVLAQEQAAKAEHAVSPGLLRWTPGGWQPVAVP